MYIDFPTWEKERYHWISVYEGYLKNYTCICKFETDPLELHFRSFVGAYNILNIQTEHLLDVLFFN